MVLFIIFLILVAALLFVYAKLPSVKRVIDEILKPEGGQVSQKRIDNAKALLEAEKKKTAELTAKAEAVKKQRKELEDTKKAIEDERLLQTKAIEEIKG